MSVRDSIGTDATVEPPPSSPGTDPTLVRGNLAAAARQDLPIISPSHYARGVEIARGGMGRIVEALDRRLGRTVALKEMLGAETDQDLIARFEREAVISARLQHPAIVAVYEAGRWENGERFYAMKRVIGRPFDKVINAARTLEERLGLIPNLMAVFDALAYAHGQNVIHRDLKPANILIGDHGETVVIDWGLAKELTVHEPEVSGGTRIPAGHGETMTGAVMGTPAYMPPEQARGDTVDERADVYALGAMLYHVLVGHPPFGVTHADDALEAVLRGPPRPLREVEPHVPEDLAAIVDKAMERAAEDRYRTAKELAQDLRRFQTGQLVGAHAYSPRDLVLRWLRRHRAAVTVAMVMLVLSGIALVAAFRSVVVARDRANAESELATARADELVLRRARDLLGTDPTAAIAWLAQYPATGPAQDEARLITAEAASLGVARHVLAAHVREVRDVAISPDGTQIASASVDGDVRLWNAVAGTGRILLDGDLAVMRVAFSPAGDQLAATTSAGAVIVWSLPGGTKRELVAGDKPVRALAWSRDGKRFAVGGDDGKVRVWSSAFGALQTFDAGGEVLDVAFTPDGATIAAGGRVRGVRAWELASSAMRSYDQCDNAFRIVFSHDAQLLAGACRDGAFVWKADGTLVDDFDDKVLVRTVTFSPDDSTLITANETGAIHLRELATKTDRVFAGHKGVVVDLAITRDGEQLITASLDQTVRVWNVKTGAHRVLAGHKDIINRIALSPDEKTVASASRDHAVRVWPLRRAQSQVLSIEKQSAAEHTAHVTRCDEVPGKPTAPDKPTPDKIAPDKKPASKLATKPFATDLVFSPRGDQLVSTWSDGRVFAWTPGQPAPRETTCRSCARSRRLAVAPSGLVAWAGRDPIAYTCDFAAPPRELRGNELETFTLAFAGERRLVTGGIDKTVRLFDLEAGTSSILHRHAGGVWTVAISPDGKRFASGGLDKTLAIGTVDAGHVDVRTGHLEAINAIAFSRDGSFVATASDDETVRRWPARGGSPEVFDLGRTVNAVDVAPDGTIVAGTTDGSVRLLTSGQREGRLVARHHGSATTVAFSPDGNFVASGGADGKVWLTDRRTNTTHVFVMEGPIARVGFSPDGARLAAGGANVRVWTIDKIDRTRAETSAVVGERGEIATPNGGGAR